MSNRNISENLEYFIDNMGVHLAVPVFELNSTDPTATFLINANFNLIGTWNLNGQPLITGSFIGSNNIDISAAPVRTIDTFWPRMARYTIAKNLVANTPQTIDWNGIVTDLDSFVLLPTQGAGTAFIQPRPGTTTDWQFLAGGYYEFQITAVATVTLTDLNSIKMEIQLSENNGVTWTSRHTQLLIKGAAGTPTVDSIGGCLTSVYAPQGAAAGIYRIRCIMTCTENKTVNLLFKWILMGRD